jgi:dipeptidyl aminopeptidase/acylaminoacyl peptidase
MKSFLYLTLILMVYQTNAQQSLTYQKPSKEILDLVDVPLAPTVLLDDNNAFMIFAYRDAFRSIQDLAREELRLGGLRIDPKTNIGSRVLTYNNLKLMALTKADKAVVQVKGLPDKPMLTNFVFSPDQQKLAFTHTSTAGIEIWVLDIITSTATKLTDARANANLGDVINWFKDGKALLVKMVSKEKEELIDTRSAVPVGPTISESDGKKAQNRTYQDLLQNKNDEHNFEQLALSELYKISLNGQAEKWLGSAMYNNISFSPDGNYVMVATVEKPFSYLVPYSRFPSRTQVYTKDAKPVATIAEVPLVEDLPKGFMAVRTGRRNISWRNDQPASLAFAVALDEGNPEMEVPFRDEVFVLDAPFSGEPQSIFKSIGRFSGIYWGNDKTAIASDYWWNTRNAKTYLFNPSDAGQNPHILFDRNYQDSYNDPGNFVLTRNEFGSRVLSLKGDNAFLLGDGFSDEGQFPFIDQLNLKTRKKTRLYQSEFTDKLEHLNNYNPQKNQVLVRIESKNEYPNYYIRHLKKQQLEQLTFFENPFQSIQNIHKEVINYKRNDGLDLAGTLYLPVGYDMDRKEKLPLILWAYPREFKDQASAAQNTQNPNAFTYPGYGSPVYWVTKGYAVLDAAAFPIVGEGDEEPNDTFIEQLVGNARAAIDAVDALGYIDRNKVAVGGHSYGAFMVANLLSNCDFFAAGIARSGAYNRTLTPFGFQSEERSYWDAPEVYNNMSPFMHADKMKTPLLLIHGEADNNSGTYPMQSERYFNALKGLGAPVRLVILPKESHGYSAKESVLHMLWEQDQWLEKHVKNKEMKTQVVE